MTQQDNLSKADVENLSPALQAVQDDAGFLGFMSSYDNARTTGILTIWDTLKEGLGTGKWENPFDPMSTPRIEAAAADNSLAAGIFGQSWANSNPVWATIFNVATNMADDPTMYIPVLGESEIYYRSLGKFGAMRTAERMIGKDATLKAFADTTADTMRGQVNQGLLNTLRTAYAQGSTRGMSGVIKALGITGVGGESDRARILLAQQAMEEPDTAKAWDLFTHGDGSPGTMGWGWQINSGKGIFNSRAAFKAMADTHDAGFLTRVRTVGGMSVASQFDALADPAGSVGFLDNLATVVGMADDKAQPVLDAYLKAALTDPDNAVSAWHTALDSILHEYETKFGVKMDDLLKWKNDALDKVVAYAPSQTGAGETSFILNTAGMDDAQKITQQRLFNQLQDDLRGARATGGTPEMLKEYEDKIRQMGRPGPATTTQMGTTAASPVSPFDLVVYKNPAWRTAVKMQQQVGLDSIMNGWRRITIGRISSAFRMDIGDDIIRPTAFLIGHNQFRAAAQYFTSSVLKAGGLLVPGVRGKILGDVDGFLETHPREGSMIGQFHQIINQGSTETHVFADPEMVGYTKALADTIRFQWRTDPMVKAWLKGFSETDPAAARTALSNYVREQYAAAGTLDPTLADALRQYQKDLKAVPAGTDATAEGARAAVKEKALARYRAAVGKKVGASVPDKLAQTTADQSRIRAWVTGQNAHLAPDLFDAAIARYDEWMNGYFENPAIRQMATSGVNDRALARLVREQAGTPHRLPLVAARLTSPFAESTVSRWATKLPNDVFEKMTGPAITAARQGGFMKMKGFYEAQMRKFFAGQPRFGTAAFEAEIEKEASARATDWIVQNTYQGVRSVAGSTLRNVFPFWGATSNMDSFYLRQAMTSPYIGSLTLHAAEYSQQSSNPAQVNSPGLTGLQGLLAHVGFGAGEGIQFNPLHAFFLTSDGIGSMVPGTGPLFAPVWNALASNPALQGLAQTIADVVPGASEQIDFNTGQAKPQFGYLADLLSGAYSAVTGQVAPEIPFLSKSTDTQNAAVDAAVQQWERQNGALDQTNPDYNSIMSGIVRQVGRDEMLQGAATFAVPVDPVVENVQAQQTAANLDTWRQATTDAQRDQVLLSFLPGVSETEWQAALTATPGSPSVAQLIAKDPQSDAALMAYEDSRVSEADHDAIANQSPWVVSTSQSKYQTQSLGPDEPDRPFDLPQWQLMRQMGDITVLAPDQFIGQVANERDINTGWLEYDNLKNQEYAAMVQNGWTTSSPLYQAWNEAVFQPQLLQIQNNHPKWATAFGSSSGTSSTAASLALATRPLRTLQTWEVLPQNSDFENQQTVLWRQALQLEGNAAGQIYELKSAGGSATEQALVMQTFQQNLESLANEDPTFAAMLAGYSFSSWEDIVNLEADEMQANQAAGYPAQVGPQGSA